MSSSGPGPAEQEVQPADFEPEAIRYIRDIETMRAVSDPTRMRILEVMVQRRSPAWSVKELAAALGMPQTRLYHHVELLVAHDLIRAVERRVVSGIIETRYNVAARSFQLDRSLFAGNSEEGFEALGEMLAAVFDTARAEVEEAVRLGVINPGADTPAERGMMLTRGLARLTPARALELRQRLQALSDEFGDDLERHDADGAQTYGVVLAVYAMPPSKESSDG